MTIFFLILAVFALIQRAEATTLSSAAAALTQGSFVQISNANMNGWNNGTPMITTGCSTFGNVITQFANNAVWNPIGKKFQFSGSAHADCGVPNPKTVIYDDATNTWSTGPQPNNSSAQPQHSYNHNALNPTNGRHYFKHYNSLQLQSMDNGAGSWTNVSTRPGSSYQCCTALTWFPDYGGGQVIWYDGDWGVWAFNPTNSQWTHLYRTLGQDGSGLPQLAGLAGQPVWMEYSPLCQCVVLGGGSNSATIYKISASGAATQLSVSGGPASVGCCSGNSTITVDPVSGKLLIMQNTILWEFNPTNSVWVNTGVSLPAFLVGSGGAGFDQIAAPISDYGVVMYVKCSSSSCQVWLYKHSPSAPDTQSPSVPTNLQASAVGSTQINLSWTASTDNVGVTGYNVERCQGSGCSSFTQVYTPVSNFQNDTGLSASTAYGYRVRAHDAAGNLSAYTSPTVYATTQAPDTQPPTNPSSLQTSVISNGQIDLNWTASTDNVGVTGYRVERCSGAGCSNFVQVYTPVTNAQSDTGLIASTSYSYRVRANDAAGNLSGYSNTATATTLGVVPGDFAARCAAPGVLRCMGFDQASDLNTGTGGFNGGYGYNYGYLPNNANYSYIALDSAVKASGNSSLRFTIPSNSGNISGQFFLNFTNPASTYQVGPGQDVYIQWRQMFSPDYINTIYWGEQAGQANITLAATSGTGVLVTASQSLFSSCSGGSCVGHHIYFNLAADPPGSTGFATITSVQDSTHATVDISTTFNKLSYTTATYRMDNGQSSWKIADISAGDLPSCTPGSPSSTTCPTTCWDFETVITNNTGGANGFPTSYANCSGPNAYQGFTGTNAPSGVTYQNVLDCPYPKATTPPCFGFVPNEWMTFQAHIHVGTWNNADSTFQLWGAREGQPSVLIIECSPTIAAPHKCASPYSTGVNYFNSNTTYKIGKIWFLPYQTSKAFTQTHPVAYTWYDEVVISTQLIADPSASLPGDTTPPTTPTGLTVTGSIPNLTLTWTASTDVGSGVAAYEIERCASLYCSNFAALQTVGTIPTFTDTGLSPGTYSYRVRARDTALNVSSYSNIATSGPATIAITSPTTAATYITSATTTTVSGNASCPNPIASVVWVNNRGGNGTATGTDNWAATIALTNLRVNDLTFTVNCP